MSLFNSLGSNYNLGFVLKSLFSTNSTKAEEDLTDYLENRYHKKATLVYKGRQAIELGLSSLNLPKDSFVAINGFTCFAVYEAIKNSGLNVEYLDIEKGEINFSADTLQKALKQNPKIKVVIIQNTLGYPCDMEKISRICKEKKIILVEDLAHSVGTSYGNGKEAGTIGDMTILSFSQDKIIDAVSGGALIKRTGAKLIHPPGGIGSHPPTKQNIDKIYPLFTYLIRTTYPYGIGKLLHFSFKKLKLLSEPMSGETIVSKLPNWYCSLVKTQFDNLQKNLNHRKKIASIYATQINPKIISFQISKLINSSSNLRFPIFVDNRKSLIKFLAGKQIFVSDIWYDSPVSPKKYLAQTDYNGQCPNAEKVSMRILNLPTHQNVTENDAKNISHLINQWLKSQ